MKKITAFSFQEEYSATTESLNTEDTSLILDIINDVKTSGDTALNFYSEKFDKQAFDCKTFTP